jgi:hypothetical protein
MLAMLVACNGDESGRLETDFTQEPPTADCLDADQDGIEDAVEGEQDADGDGTPNRADTDSDGDGVTDDLERVSPKCMAPADSDRDNTPDYLDLDSDGDGIPDAPDPLGTDTDADGIPDSRDADDDGDRIADVDEVGANPPMLRDTDGDGMPDLRDIDSDNDGVRDSPSGLADLDGDGILDYLDDDTDGDGVPDVHELGDDVTSPRDTDADRMPDYLDADSDGDGLADGAEDENGNGTVDAGESSPTLKDSDGDGADDLVEQAAMTDPNDAAKNPQADGNFVFVMPYEMEPTPETATLDFATDIKRADVVFSMDTTGSMGGAVDNLKAALSTQIVPDLSAQIPDLGFAISNYEDVPVGSFGSFGDLPFELGSPVTIDVADAQSALNAILLGSGGDGPESGIEALFQIATGAGLMWPADSMFGLPAGSIPELDMMFRPGAFPIVIQISDAENHSASTYGTFVPDAASREDAYTALEAISARVIMVNVGQSPTALSDHLEIVETTGAVVPPEAFGATGQCLTGLAGAPQAPNANGECPLLFNVDFSGGGLGNSIVDAVEALVGAVSLDIDARPVNEDSNPGDVDAVAAFLDRVTPSTAPNAMTMCVPGLPVEDRLGGDGQDDTFVDVSGGVRVCFDVVPKINTTVMPTREPQLFRARIDVYGDDITVLDDRAVWFVVPPKPPMPGGVM